MFVPDAIRHCVVFLGLESKDGRFLPKATGFLVDAGEGDYLRTHLITAEHVVGKLHEMAAKTDEIIVARLNTADGASTTVPLDDAHWWFYPDQFNPSDVAVTPFSFSRKQFAHSTLLVRNRDISDRILRDEGGALGQEILILGLFRHHSGTQRNEPIVRIGNLSAMPQEPVKTEYAGFIEGYLVEARSISGLSGSPVFLNLMDLHSFDESISEADKEAASKVKSSADEFVIAKDHSEKGLTAALAKMRADNVLDLGRFPLLGLMHGHWDVSGMEEAVIEDANGGRESVNVGIGVVIPIRKILETIYQPELVKERAMLQEEERNRDGAVSDLVEEDPEHPTADNNPHHKEDFNSLLDAAVRKTPQGD